MENPYAARMEMEDETSGIKEKKKTKHHMQQHYQEILHVITRSQGTLP